MEALLATRLTREVHQAFPALSRDPKAHNHTSLWVGIVRLWSNIWGSPALTCHFRRHYTLVYLVLQRFLREGLKSLLYCPLSGATAKLIPQTAAFLHERHSEEQLWITAQLVESIAERFGVCLFLAPDSRNLRAMGCV